MSSVGRLRGLLMLVLAAFTAPVLAANCDDGLKVYITGDAVSAMKIFQGLAKRGDSCAQFNLGLMYFYGHGTDVDLEQARKLVEQAAKAGYPKAREAIQNWEAMKRKPDLTSGAGSV